jgi:hypothetical protein
MCGTSEVMTEAEILPVLIDDNMETEMCEPCIKIARSEMTIEILT